MVGKDVTFAFTPACATLRPCLDQPFSENNDDAYGVPITFSSCQPAGGGARRGCRAGLPARFTEAGQQVWQVFRNQLTAADLVLLAIEDAVRGDALAFRPRHVVG